MNKNDDKVREILMEEPIPQALEPENIAKMLNEKAPAKKRKSIARTASRITAGAAACAVICTSAVYFAGQDDKVKKNNSHIQSDDDEKDSTWNTIKPTLPGVVADEEEPTEKPTEAGEDNKKDEDVTKPAAPVETVSHLTGASDYEEVFDYLKKYAKENNKYTGGFAFVDGVYDSAVDFDEEEAAEAPEAEPDKAPSEAVNGVDDSDENKDENDFYDTYNQEEGVLEADIVKTDGEYIYYIYNNNTDDKSELNIAKVKDGKFVDTEKTELKGANAKEAFKDDDIKKDNVRTTVDDMYLYNDMLIVVGNISVYDEVIYGCYECDCYYPYGIGKTASYVSVYTTGIEPELLGTYYQEGGYQDVRIAPDGFMYLITTYRTGMLYETDDYVELKNYVPLYGIDEDVAFAAPMDIYLPEDELKENSCFESTVIGSLDFNKSGEFSKGDIKVLTGYSDQAYCTADNIYVTFGWNDTEITRFAVGNGKITAAASGKVSGRVKDQFSMSEYDGYFRIATTKDTMDEEEDSYTWFDDQGIPHEETYTATVRRKRDNRVYVLDLALNEVGSIKDLGIDEEIKSVNFSGSIAYVVTYEQTDPLFAIDLSDPKKPKLLDEFKIKGYSTYMQQWQDGELFGFGVAADANGIEYGLKLTMFDNSDPDDLKALDTYEIGRSESEWLWSAARNDRKALLIAPKKNIIGVQYEKNYYSDVEFEGKSGFMFFSFENGEFKHLGTLSVPMDMHDYNAQHFLRAVYIGDYIYMVSGEKFISAEIDTINKIDEAKF